MFDLGGGTFEYYSDFNIAPSLTVDGTAVDADYVETDDGPYFAGFTLPDGNTVTLEVSTGFTYDSDVGTYIMTGTATFAEEGDYAVSYTNTSITITPMVLHVYSPDHTKTYDGEPYPLCTDDLSDYPELLQAWALGTEYTDGAQVDAGTYENEIDYYLLMTGGTENYDVRTHPGTITIEKRAVTLTSEGGSKKYDGTALTKPDVSVEGSFAEGEVMEVTASGSATNVEDGQVTNTITVLKGDTYKDSNYTITKTEGKLSITPRSVTLTSSDGSRTYDGKPLTKPDVTVGGDGFVSGEVSDIKATGSVTTVEEGEVENTISYTKGASFKDGNYTITQSKGKLSITPASLGYELSEDPMALTLYFGTETYELNGIDTLSEENPLVATYNFYTTLESTGDNVHITVTYTYAEEDGEEYEVSVSGQFTHSDGSSANACYNLLLYAGT